jgi:SAM-dependent methyltransferase
LSELPREAFRRVDELPDADFYREPRFVLHIDHPAILTVTQIYRETFPPGGAILDLMSSWVSHLPPEIVYARVAGLGLNAAELAENPRLCARVVQDLNRDTRLPYAEREFDAAGCCVSIDYLTRPVDVLREVGRVLKPGAPFVVTFSNRCFPTKAVAIWHGLSDGGRLKLVEKYFDLAGCFEQVTAVDRSPDRGGGDPLFAVIGRARH